MDGDDCMDAPRSLLEMIGKKADIRLVFGPAEPEAGTQQKQSTLGKRRLSSTSGSCKETDTGCSTDTLKANSCLLSLNSSVLAPMIEVALSERSSSGSLKRIPIYGSSRADFLTVLAFVYPITPLAKVTWENLEVVIVEGDKWGMQVPHAHATEFIVAKAGSLSMTPGSQRFVFKWLQLADRAGLTDAVAACVDRLAADGADLCIWERLEWLSPSILIQLVERLAAASKHCQRYHYGRGYDQPYTRRYTPLSSPRYSAGHSPPYSPAYTQSYTPP